MKGSQSRVRTGFLSLLFLLVVPSTPALAADLREGLDQMAAQLAKGAPEGKQFRVAVADFPDLQGVISDLGRFIANRITTRLVQNPKFSVIERQRLNQVLGELKFSISDLVDPNKAKQLGRMVGVEGLVVGAVSDLGNQVDIDARMIEIESNKMLLGATVTISKDPTVTALLERGREMPAPPSAGGPIGSPMIAAPALGVGARSVKYQEFPKFRVEVDGLQVSARGNVVLFLAYVNKTQETLTIGLDDPGRKTFVLDSAGNGLFYREGSGLSGGWKGYSWESKTSFLTLSPGARASASFVFSSEEKIKKMGTAFHFTSEQAFVDVEKGKPAGHFNVTIRDIEPR